MKNGINENTKVILTFGQLKKLVSVIETKKVAGRTKVSESVLRGGDKQILLDWVYNGDVKALENDLPQIEDAANVTKYELYDSDDNFVRRLGRIQAIKMLGHKSWLAGLSRSAFHRTAMQNTMDGKYCVYFDSKELFN